MEKEKQSIIAWKDFYYHNSCETRNCKNNTYITENEIRYCEKHYKKAHKK